MLGLCRCFSPRARVQQLRARAYYLARQHRSVHHVPVARLKARQVKGGRAFCFPLGHNRGAASGAHRLPAGAGQERRGVSYVLRVPHDHDNCKSDTDSAVLSHGQLGRRCELRCSARNGLARLCAHIHVRRCAHRKARHGSADGRGAGHSRVSGGNTAAHQP